MEKKGSLNHSKCIVCIVTFFVLLLVVLLPNQRLVYSVANVAVYPSIVAAGQGQSFVVNITISSVNRLYGWEFKLNWTSSYLDAVSVSEGPFLKIGDRNTFFTNRVNNTEGHLIVDCTLLGTIPGVTGEGVLASMTFRVKTVGQCLLDLYEVSLLDDSLDPQSIPCESSGGYWSSVGSGHDVAVTDVKPSKTVIGQGFCAFINVTVLNFGEYSETFNTTTAANDIVIHADSVSLASGFSAMLSFLWNVSSFPVGVYVVESFAEPVGGETITSNNAYVFGQISVAKRGDINSNVPDSPDGRVDMKDVAAVARPFGMHYGDDLWNGNADITGVTLGLPDGIIDMRDISLVARNFGT